MTPKLTKYIPHTLEKIWENPKQVVFLLCDQLLEVFYGGAGGGGKSEALLMGAAQYVDVPGYAALVLRRTYKDLSLPEALMSRADMWWRGSGARWDREERTWYFPTGPGWTPATITFGYLETENDKFRYQSAAFQYIAFDELTQFTGSQYTFLFSRLRRRAGVQVPLRMRAASNPGGVGHDWVKERFIDVQIPGKRIFIPATIRDNPFIDAEEYEKSLEELDPITRAQIKAGDWTARHGGSKFKREWFKLVDDYPRDLRNIIRYWDLASTEPKQGKDPDWTVGLKIGERNGQYWILDVMRSRATPFGVAEIVRQMAELDTRGVTVYMEQEPGASGVTQIEYYTRFILKGFAFYGHRSTGSKEVRANPASSAAQAGNIFLLRGRWNAVFLDELEAFPLGSHDDQVDALSGGLEAITQNQLVFGIHYGLY